MNHIYRKVWNRRLGAFVAVAEIARSCGKAAGAGVLVTAASAAFAADPGTLPTGGQVSAGSAAIAQQGNAMTITQDSQRAAINWQGFSIGKDASVNFVQPNAQAVALNRVTGTQASVIDGVLKANGQVFVLNPNGVLFGKGARVDTAGLVASTRGLSDADFMAGKTTFSGSGTGSVVNEGTLNAAEGGYVALIGQQVRNDGLISARLGHVALAAGNRVTLNFNGSSLVGVTLEQGALDSLVANGGAILADGGEVLLTAKAAEGLLDGMVNHTGEIRAHSIVEREGKIVLLGDMDSGTTTVSGTLDASAPEGGNGGFIETSAAKVQIADSARITTQAAEGRTGTWLIDPNDYTIAASGGDITGAVLSAQLDNNNVVIQSTDGTNDVNGDIFVNDAVSWSANNYLTLEAERNIYINKPITATGASGELRLYYGQATGDGTVGGTPADYYVNAPISLQDGENFTTRLGSLGSDYTYTVVNTLGELGSSSFTDLIGMLNQPAFTHLALGADMDATGITFAQSVAGNNTPTVFTGLGHQISNINITGGSHENAAFFGGVREAMTVRDLLLDTVTVSGSGMYAASALVAHPYSGLVSISGVAVTNLSVSGATSSGGLIGIMDSWSSARIVRTSVQGTVGGTESVGGLVGYHGGMDGGLSVADSYTRVDVTGGLYIGGFVGYAGAGTTIERSYQVGSGASGAFVGALGMMGGGSVNVINSFWDSSVTGAAGVAVNPGIGGYGWTVTTTGTVPHATAQMTDPTTFTDAGWDFSATGPWLHKSTLNDGYPVLRAAWTPSTTSLLLSLSSPLSMIYGDTLPALTGLSLTGCVGCLTVDWGTALSSTTNVGSYAYASTPNIFSLSWANGFDPADYDVTLPSGFFTIDPRTLTLDTISGATRVYNGLTDAAAALFTLGNVVNSDTVTLGGNATLDSKNVGTRSVSSISGLTLSNSNYTLDGVTASGTVDITPRALSVSSIEVAPRVYDGTNLITGGITNNWVGYIGGDILTPGVGSSFVYDSADAGARTATINVPTLSGVDAGNYTWTPVINYTTSALITPKPVTLSGFTVDAKVYDGTSTGSATGGTLDGLVGSETLVFAPTVTFTSANAGATAQVGATLADGSNGGKASNYSVTLSADGTAITPRPVQAGKVYDGTTTFAGADLVVQNLVAGDVVTGTGSGILSGAGTGVQTLDSPGTLSLTGAAAGNYTLNGSSFLVLPRPVNLSTVAGASKVYDGSTAVADTLLQITNIVSGESLGLSGTGTLDAANVGSRTLVGVTGLTLTGADAGNYTLVGATPSGSVTVTARPVNVVAITGASRVYDGTTDAGSTLLELGNLVTGDSVSLAGQATLASANVGAQAITGLTGLTLTGTDAGNYTLTGVTPTGSVAITARPVTVANVTGASKVYDGSTDAGSALLQLGNLVTGDSVSLAGQATLTSANAGTQAIAGLTGLTLTGVDAGNYTLVGSTPTGNVTITARPVSVTAITGASRVYDGTTVASTDLLLISGVLSGEEAGLTGSAALAGKGVGTQALTTGSLALGNPNYVLDDSALGSVTITPRLLEVSFTVSDKVFDGSAAANVQTTDNRIAGDSFSVDFTAAFADTAAGSGKPVLITGLGLAGEDASNYQLADSAGEGVTGTLLLRPVNYTLSTTEPGKVYMANGTTLLTPEQLDQLVLQSWANTVTGTAPGTLVYTIWKDGQQVAAVREAGVYEIRAQFAAQDAHYAIADTGNTTLQIKVQDSAIDTVIAQAILTLPQPPVLPGTLADGSSVDMPQAMLPNVVTVPPTLADTLGQSTALALVSAPRGGETSTGVTLAQARTMLDPAFGAGNAGSTEVRVPVSRHSLAEIVNGGIRLPADVDQLLFVVKTEEE